MQNLIFAALGWLAEPGQYCKEPPAPAQAELQTVGIARKSAHTQVEYCEWYFTQGSQSTRVLYAFADGEIFAEKSLDYRHGDARPQVKQIDHRQGEQRQVLRKGKQWQLLYRENKNAKLQQETVPAQEIEVVDAGFVAKVQEHWQSLQEKKEQDFNFASPVHGKNIGLTVQRTDIDHCLENDKNQTQTDSNLCMRIKLDNAVLSLFTDDLHLLFNQQKQLIRFIGTVNIVSEDGDSQSLVIDYHHRD